MITLQRNRQRMKYAVSVGKKPIYVTDVDGNIVIDEETGEPIETGEYELSYSSPVGFKAYIGSQLEDAITRAYGSDNSNNFAVLVISKTAKDDEGNPLSFENGTRIWRKSEVKVKPDGSVDETSADYEVDGVMDEELNETSYYLRKRK